MADNILIDIPGFRKKNGLKQSDLADFLGTTRGYISVVETKKEKLSAKNIDKILDRWGPSGLIPCYDRLSQLCFELASHDRIELERMDDDLPFEDLLSAPVVKGIKYGRIGISDEIANKIIAAFPDVNKRWLVTGVGDMFDDDMEARMNTIEAKLDSVLEKLDYIISRLGKHK